MHACGMQIHWRHGRLHTPIVDASTTDTSIVLSTVFPTSGRTDHTKFALRFTQHYFGQCGVQVLQFQPAACSSFASSHNDLRFPPLVATCRPAPKPILSWRGPKTPDPSAPPAVVALITLTGDHSQCFDKSSGTCRLPYVMAWSQDARPQCSTCS